MWQNIINVVQSGAAFLQNGKAPPNTTGEMRRIMEDENHLSSKKFFIIFTAAIALILIYFISVGILFFIPRTVELVTAYTTIFAKMMEIFAIIVATYIGAQGMVDLRYNSQSSAALEGNLERKDVNIKQEILTNNAKEDDYNISEVQV
jgi:hypothetical protein